ncbi:hypothetical protein PNA2_1330 [Pyrococcus sp. NA2]|uniref:hypothetical protein n=1 Tax=Pyrococcus sp. (strain NA2) TaxID=342949 RepID=UPI000209ADF9|nr:hypothetical protein [Pyrococcus sp. NA2]AEC52245.1 hypothetical protein PNA2_1330 [Pyrococcus sp. NA2]
MLKIYIVAFEFLDESLARTAIENVEEELKNLVIQNGSHWLSVEGYLLADVEKLLEDKEVKKKIAKVVQDKMIR